MCDRHPAGYHAKYAREHRASRNSTQRKYRSQQPDRSRVYTIRGRYGLTVEEYEDILSRGCAICGEAATHLDHNHATGATREGLCREHNMGLGLFGDDPDMLLAAAAYLLKHAVAEDNTQFQAPK